MIARWQDSQQVTNKSHHVLTKPLISEALFEFTADPAERDIHGILLGDDQDVESLRQLSAVAPKKFPHEPFDPIPDDRVAHFAADCDAQPGLADIIGFADNDEIGGVNLFTGSRESQEFGSFS
jgi:hypothetical protein